MTVTTEINGTACDLTLPLDQYEWEFGTFCDYRAAEQEFLRINRETGEEEHHHVVERALADALATVAGPAVHELPIALPGDDLGALVDTGYTVGLEDDLSQLRIYAHLTALARRVEPSTEEMAQKFKPETLPVELVVDHGGHRFRVVRDRAARVLQNKPLTTIEAIEAQEYQRRRNEQREALGAGITVDQASALDFTLGLTQVALLLRRDGELIPAGESARERWLSKRRELLTTIDLGSVMDVRFFCAAALVRSRSGGSISSTPKALRVVR